MTPRRPSERVGMDTKTNATDASPAEVAAAEIAAKILGIETLQERKRDCLDFHDLHVAQIKDALVRAYELGREARS